MNNRMHIFYFFADRWFDEEFNGPLDATTYLDPETGQLYLEVRKGEFISEWLDESWTVQVEPVVCRLEGIIPCDIAGPPSWSAYESVLPESVLPLKTRATKPAKHNTIDASWRAAW
jgi:hypothetical protein